MQAHDGCNHSVTLTFYSPPAVTTRPWPQGLPMLAHTPVWDAGSIGLSLKLRPAPLYPAWRPGVAFSCCLGLGLRGLPASMAGTASQRTRAPYWRCPGRQPTGGLHRRRWRISSRSTCTSPVSTPRSICMMETPVSVFAVQNSHANGLRMPAVPWAATHQLMQPCFGFQHGLGRSSRSHHHD